MCALSERDMFPYLRTSLIKRTDKDTTYTIYDSGTREQFDRQLLFACPIGGRFSTQAEKTDKDCLKGL